MFSVLKIMEEGTEKLPYFKLTLWYLQIMLVSVMMITEI